MGKIATKGWINSNKKTVSGWSGDSKCPTRSEIESADSSLGISRPIYASNQLVQQVDIEVYGWNYYFTRTPTSISDNGAGGNYTINVNSKRVRTVNGVETGTEEYVGWTFSESLSWVSGVMENPLTSTSRLRVTVSGGSQFSKSGSISFQQTGTSNTFSVSVSLASSPSKTVELQCVWDGSGATYLSVRGELTLSDGTKFPFSVSEWAQGGTTFIGMNFYVNKVPGYEITNVEVTGVNIEMASGEIFAGYLQNHIIYNTSNFVELYLGIYSA